MGLTRPRAYQIYDIDYKQSVRVITLTNITLSGGAPNQVDGVTLGLNDRVLVAGQNTGSENGLYYVTSVGTGSNGTWQRSVDGNQTGEIEAGMIVMVTEGATWADTSWKLITNDPIIIGTTALVFEQNTGDAFGSVNANGTSITANVASSILNLTAGNNISITGNNDSKTVSIAVTGISLNSISNGNSNVNVVSSGGNVTVGVNGTSNLAVFSTEGLSVSGNVTANYFLGNVACASGIFTTKIFNGTSEVNIGSSGGNANISIGGVSNVAVFSTAGLSVAGNVTANYVLGNGSALTGINAFSNISVSGGNSAVADSISDTLTLSAGDGISIIIDSSTDTVTIATTGGSDIFVDGADFGTIDEIVTNSSDLGLITATVTAESDLGSIVISGLIYPDQFVLPSYTTSNLPSASVIGAMIFVTNESGGSVPAFADGTNWRRVTDRAIIS